MDIVYEDNNVIVINKEAGILIHPDKYTRSNTLVDFLKKHYPQISQVGESIRPGIVHRLDKDTSGLIICAKNQEAYKYLIAQFINKKVVKKYQALVFGIIKDDTGIITYAISKKGQNKKLDATTRYKVIKYFQGFTLLDITIETGRMHQIRQHLKMIGHPIVGDREYTFKNLEDPYPLNRLFLHSYYLKIELPNKKVEEFKIDLPKNLKNYLEKIEQKKIIC